MEDLPSACGLRALQAHAGGFRIGGGKVGIAAAQYLRQKGGRCPGESRSLPCGCPSLLLLPMQNSSGHVPLHILFASWLACA